MENVRLWIGHFPAQREIGLQLKLFAFLDQRIEHQLVEPLGISVRADAGIEIRWRLIESYGDNAWICCSLARACGR